MSTQKKILIAYDGSECANAALEDLKKAGLPKKTEALVVTIADVFAPEGEFSKEPIPRLVAAQVKRSWEQAQHKVKDAKRVAEKAAQKLKTTFPTWNIKVEAFADSPSWGVIKKAQVWKADLVVVGARGLHSTGRLALGSLSQIVATQAPCSVRIVHTRPEDVNSPVRIVIGVDGSSSSYEALNEVVSRHWNKGAALHIITVTDERMMTAIFSSDKSLRDLIKKSPDNHWAKRLMEHAAQKLSSPNFKITSFTKEGDPKKVLLEEAKKWGADSIFVGARGISGIVHSLIGSVSASLAARSDATVEIVRTLKKSKR